MVPSSSLCFFLGPGRPLGLGSPVPFAVLLTPFFFGPSVGGPIDAGTGVSVAGVAGLESDGFSSAEPFVGAGGLEEAAAASWTSSLAGESSLFKDSGSTIARNFRGSILRVTESVGRFAVCCSGVLLDARMTPALLVVLLDFRRSLVAVVVLVDAAIISALMCDTQVANTVVCRSIERKGKYVDRRCREGLDIKEKVAMKKRTLWCCCRCHNKYSVRGGTIGVSLLCCCSMLRGGEGFLVCRDGNPDDSDKSPAVVCVSGFWSGGRLIK